MEGREEHRQHRRAGSEQRQQAPRPLRGGRSARPHGDERERRECDGVVLRDERRGDARAEHRVAPRGPPGAGQAARARRERQREPAALQRLGPRRARRGEQQRVDRERDRRSARERGAEQRAQRDVQHDEAREREPRQHVAQHGREVRSGEPREPRRRLQPERVARGLQQARLPRVDAFEVVRTVALDEERPRPQREHPGGDAGAE
jgi:hypothetical protein